MANSFVQLTKLLERKRIPLAKFQEYLYYCCEKKFDLLTTRLESRGVSLPDYSVALHSFLENSVFDSPTLLVEQQNSFELLGVRLLNEGKIELRELNDTLKELTSEKKQSSKALLQALLKKNKIEMELFFELLEDSKQTNLLTLK